MHLSQTEIELFFKLWYALIWGVNQKHNIVSDLKKPVYYEQADIEAIAEIRGELWENPQWIDEFLRDNDDGEFSEIERGILAGWRKEFVKGKFWVIKHLARYSVLMSSNDPKQLYGVSGITDSIKDVVTAPTPFIIETILLPFKDRIIYDSLIGTFNISFGKGIRDEIKNVYDENRVKIGVIEAIGEPPIPMQSPPTRKKPKKPAPPLVDTKGAKVPKAMSARYMEIAEIMEDFCDKRLDEEYKEMCLRALQKLCRKRPSPVSSGKARTWACGIVYAIGSNNFIFDKSQPIHMTATEIAEGFGLSKGTAGSKATEVTWLLDLSYFNTEFMLTSHIESNPMIWYLKVNGYVVDIRTMPRGAQEEAFHKGLIPYIPADKEL
jgi:hypothetical protein